MNWYKSQTLCLTRDIEYIREVTKSMSKDKLPEMTDEEWEQQIKNEEKGDKEPDSWERNYGDMADEAYLHEKNRG